MHGQLARTSSGGQTLLLVRILVACVLTFASHPAAAHAAPEERYDASGLETLTSEATCAAASVVCLDVPPNATSVRLAFTEDVNPLGLPVPGHVTTVGDSTLPRGTLCGSGEVPLPRGTTQIVIRFVPLPLQACDFPCEADCSLTAIPRAGLVTFTFTTGNRA